MKKEEINYPALLVLGILMLAFYVASALDKNIEKSSYDNTHEIIEQVEMEHYGVCIPISEI